MPLALLVADSVTVGVTVADLVEVTLAVGVALTLALRLPGPALPVKAPLPNSPKPPSPQQEMAPAGVRAHVWDAPAVRPAALSTDREGGMETVATLPVPSCPLAP